MKSMSLGSKVCGKFHLWEVSCAWTSWICSEVQGQQYYVKGSVDRPEQDLLEDLLSVQSWLPCETCQDRTIARLFMVNP